MKKIVGVGFSIPSENDEDYIKLDSVSSLSDYDIVIFNPDLRNTNYTSEKYTPTYEGETLYSKDACNKITKHFEHWKKEIDTFLDNGKTVLINLCPVKHFYVYAGTRTVSGTGKSAKYTEHVSKKTNYDFLPIKLDIHNSSGKIIVPAIPTVKPFFEAFKDIIRYEAHLPMAEGQTIFTTKNKDKILGKTIKHSKGNIIFLPYLDFYIPEFYNDDADDFEWTEEAIKAGQIFINNLVELDKHFKIGYETTPPPDWLEHTKYTLSGSKKTKEEINGILAEIRVLHEKEEELKSKLVSDELLMNLLFETGKPLEHAVTKALQLMGYKAENFDDGTLELDQVIISPEDDRFIGECEGKDNKAIDIGKFRQLHDSLNEDFYRDEVSEKAYGLLFGNPERLIVPLERKFGFTEKCIQGAKREKIGLIKTADLFEVAKYLLENHDEEYKKLCRKAIKEQLGKIIHFPQPKKKS